MSNDVRFLPRDPKLDGDAWCFWACVDGRPMCVYLTTAAVADAALIPDEAIGAREAMAVVKENEAAICAAIRDGMSAGLFTSDRIVLGAADVDGPNAWSSEAIAMPLQSKAR